MKDGRPVNAQRIQHEYFDWMYRRVMSWSEKRTYYRLMSYLNSREFTYIKPMDSNRYADGIDLRYRFGDDVGYSADDISQAFDHRPCSVFEMMVALAIRCEEQIMFNPDYGDRTSHWFWVMIENLALENEDDDNCDEWYVGNMVDIFLSNDIDPDGTGGLFRIESTQHDMRYADIWYQMNWYLSEVVKKEG